jgi:hypothetical protein
MQVGESRSEDCCLTLNKLEGSDTRSFALIAGIGEPYKYLVTRLSGPRPPWTRTSVTVDRFPPCRLVALTSRSHDSRWFLKIGYSHTEILNSTISCTKMQTRGRRVHASDRASHQQIPNCDSLASLSQVNACDHAGNCPLQPTVLHV